MITRHLLHLLLDCEDRFSFMDRSCDIGQLHMGLGLLHVVVAKVNLVDVERIIVALA